MPADRRIDPEWLAVVAEYVIAVVLLKLVGMPLKYSIVLGVGVAALSAVCCHLLLWPFILVGAVIAPALVGISWLADLRYDPPKLRSWLLIVLGIILFCVLWSLIPDDW